MFLKPVTVYKVKKGKRIFYVRIEMEVSDDCIIGYQCYKEDGEFIYSKWSSLKSLEFKRSEIIDEFKKDVVD